MTAVAEKPPYVHVTPHDHDESCRRGQDPTSEHYGIDRERCERCRNLWQRLLDVRDCLRALKAEA